MYVRTVEPEANPISLDEVKRQLRIDTSDTSEDDLLNISIKSAVRQFETVTNRALMPQTWEWRGSYWPGVSGVPVDVIIDLEYWIRLRYAPISVFNSVKYYDTNNVLQTLAATEYRTDTGSTPGRIKFTGSLPSLYDRADTVIINYSCGYADKNSVPENIKSILLIAVGTLNENRQVYSQGMAISNIKNYYDELVSSHILPF